MLGGISEDGLTQQLLVVGNAVSGKQGPLNWRDGGQMIFRTVELGSDLSKLLMLYVQYRGQPPKA